MKQGDILSRHRQVVRVINYERYERKQGTRGRPSWEVYGITSPRRERLKRKALQVSRTEKKKNTSLTTADVFLFTTLFISAITMIVKG